MEWLVYKCVDIVDLIGVFRNEFLLIESNLEKWRKVLISMKWEKSGSMFLEERKWDWLFVLLFLVWLIKYYNNVFREYFRWVFIEKIFLVVVEVINRYMVSLILDLIVSDW